MKWMKPSAILLSLVIAAFVGGPAAGKSKNSFKGKINAWVHKGDSGSGHDWSDGDGEGDDHEDRGVSRNDFALFDGSNPLNQPDAGAVCGARRGKPFTYHLSVANYGSDGVVRVTYADGDWIQFPIASGGSFSTSQAGGSRGGDDAVVRVSNGGSGAQLAGALSAEGGRCASCDADGGIGDVGCDAFVPN